MNRMISMAWGPRVWARVAVVVCVVLVFALAAGVALAVSDNKPITPTIVATTRAEHDPAGHEDGSFVGKSHNTCDSGCHGDGLKCDKCHFVGPAPALTAAQAAAPAPIGHVALPCTDCHTVLPGANTPPVLAPIGDKSVDELTLLAFTATAIDTDLPPDTLTFTLDAGAPQGAAITAGGAFTWTPSEAQGPGSYPITVTVSDGRGGTDSETITVTVNEVAEVTFVLTPSAGANGAISPATPQTVASGSDLTFTITPDAGYHIADVLVDGASVGAVGSYTFTDVTANHTIAASFEADHVCPLPTKITIRASACKIERGETITLSSVLRGGDVSGVEVEYLVKRPGSGRFVPLGTSTVGTDGTSSLEVTLTKNGSYFFRVRFMGTDGLQPSISRIVHVVVSGGHTSHCPPTSLR